MTASPATDRPPLSRERILAAAIAIADEDGLDALSMRRLGTALGVEAMSLYHHVASKDALLDGIVDVGLSGVELPAPGADWRAGVRTIARSCHAVLARHPWAAGLMLSRTIPARFRYMEALLGNLRSGGLSPTQTDHAYHALDSYIAGFTLWQVGMALDDAALPELARSFLATLDAERNPFLVEHIHEHLRERDPADEGSFAFGLELILDGLERIRAGGR
jgi:AcrR family transcriptional regulator